MRTKIVSISSVIKVQDLINKFNERYRMSYFLRTTGYEFLIYDIESRFLISDRISVSLKENEIKVISFYPCLKVPSVNLNGIAYVLLKDFDYSQKELEVKANSIFATLQDLMIITSDGTLRDKDPFILEQKLSLLEPRYKNIADLARFVMNKSFQEKKYKYMSATAFYLMISRIVLDNSIIKNWAVELMPARDALNFYQKLLPFNFKSWEEYHHLEPEVDAENTLLVGEISGLTLSEFEKQGHLVNREIVNKHWLLNF